MTRYRTSRRTQPSLITKFNAERDAAPESGPAGYYFRWSDRLQAYDLSSYNSQYSDHLINEQMIVTLFRDVHSIRMKDPKKTNFLAWLNCVSLLGGIVAAALFFAFGYNQKPTVKYEVMNYYQGAKFVTEKEERDYLIYTPMVAMAHFLFGVISWLIINVVRIQKMQLGRMMKRIQQIKEVFERHKAITFSGVRVSLQTGSYGAYIGLKFDWKLVPVGANMPGMLNMGYNAPLMSFNAPPRF